jgi:hypothetical protein
MKRIFMLMTLALMLAAAMALSVVLGVATTALGANGDFFKAGKANIGASHVPLTSVERGPFV